jgi:hypothetical protein
MAISIALIPSSRGLIRASPVAPTAGCGNISTAANPMCSSCRAPRISFRPPPPAGSGSKRRVSAIASRYRPRIEGLFARIERWASPDGRGGYVLAHAK